LKGLVSRQAFILSLTRLGAILALWVLAVSIASAQTKAQTPEGIPAGRWFLAPYAFFGFEYDDNIFRRSEEVLSDESEPALSGQNDDRPGGDRPPSEDPPDDELPPEEIVADLIQRTTLGLVATLPVRRSSFVFDYRADRRAYQETPVPRDWSHDAIAAWRMRLASSDRLNFGTRYVLGISDTQRVDPGGELTFEAIPFQLARFNFDASRDVPDKPGYAVRISYSTLTWQPGPDPEEDSGLQRVPFFDYKGWDASAEYLHPISPTKWLMAFGSFRRFDHFEPEGDPEYNPGVPYRSEESGNIQIGMRGDLGFEQPFFFRLGWGRFRYTGDQPSLLDYTGFVGQADWRLRIGGRSHLALGWNLRPLPSSFSTYYVVNEFTAVLERDWLVYSKVGIDLLYSRNRYGEPIEGSTCGPDVTRDDRRWRADAFVDWLVHRKFGLRVAYGRHGRDSNCEGVDYRADVLTTGFTLGWF
jgi:hypothetical protein